LAAFAFVAGLDLAGLPVAARAVFLGGGLRAAAIFMGALALLGTLKLGALRKVAVWRSRDKERSG